MRAMAVQKLVKKFNKDDIILQDGAPANSEICFLQRGTACVEVKGQVVGTIHPGEWFGEMAAILNSNRTATVRALTPCEVLVFKGLDDANLNEALKKDPKILQKLLEQLAMRVLETTRRQVRNVEELDVQVERYRKAISGTLFALDKVVEKYKSKVMEEVRDHLRVASGMPMGEARDVDERAFATSKPIVLG